MISLTERNDQLIMFWFYDYAVTVRICWNFVQKVRQRVFGLKPFV